MVKLSKNCERLHRSHYHRNLRIMKTYTKFHKNKKDSIVSLYLLYYTFPLPNSNEENFLSGFKYRNRTVPIIPLYDLMHQSNLFRLKGVIFPTIHLFFPRDYTSTDQNLTLFPTLRKKSKAPAKYLR